MKVYEYAKANGMTNDEVKAKFGLKSHLSIIPEEAPVEMIERVAEDELDEVVVEIKSTEAKVVSAPCPVSLADLAQSIQIHGVGSPVYKWRHLLNGN